MGKGDSTPSGEVGKGGRGESGRGCKVAGILVGLRSSILRDFTPPWRVPSPGEKGGGLGVRLATSPHKTVACYRNTYKNEPRYLSSWAEAKAKLDRCSTSKK